MTGLVISRRGVLRYALTGTVAVFGAPLRGAMGNDPTYVIKHQQNFQPPGSSYGAFPTIFADMSGFTFGEQYDSTITVTPTTFPNGSKIYVKVPAGPITAGLGIWSYSAITFANFNGGPSVGTPVAPRQICNIEKFDVAFEWSYSGSEIFGLLAEMWLTWQPRPGPDQGHSGFYLNGSTTNGSATIANLASTSGIEVGLTTSGNGIPTGARVVSFTSNSVTISAPATATADGVALRMSPALFEVGFLWHQHNMRFHNSGKLIGTTFVSDGISYTVRVHDLYITVMEQSGADVLSGAPSAKALLDYLVEHRAITGNEWVNGFAFGVEMGSKPGNGTHATEVTLASYDITFEGSRAGPAKDFLGPDLLGPAGDNVEKWNLAAGLGTPVRGQTDMDGGTTATFLPEDTSTGPHGPLALSISVPARACDMTLYFDLKGAGRDWISDTLSALRHAHRVQSLYDLRCGAAITIGSLNTGLTLIRRQIIDCGNDWRRITLEFRKAAGLTELHYALAYHDGTSTSYAGDTGRGFVFRNCFRLVMNERA